MFFWCFVSLVFFYPNFVYLPWHRIVFLPSFDVFVLSVCDALNGRLRTAKGRNVLNVSKRGILSNRLEFNMNSRSMPGHGDIASEFIIFIGGYRMIYRWILHGFAPGAINAFRCRLLERTQPGHFVESPCFAFAGLDGLQLRLYPKGELCQAFFNSLIQEVRYG